MDIYNNKIPFGLLSQEEQEELNAHQGDFNYWSYCTYEWKKLPSRPVWCFEVVYRAVKPIPTKPSINWDHVSEEYNWLARDNDGVGYLYPRKPISYEYSGSWREGGMALRARSFSSYQPGNCEWKDSLVRRPTPDESLM